VESLCKPRGLAHPSFVVRCSWSPRRSSDSSASILFSYQVELYSAPEMARPTVSRWRHWALQTVRGWTYPSAFHFQVPLAGSILRLLLADILLSLAGDLVLLRNDLGFFVRRRAGPTAVALAKKLA
jgi:hypothetical protein